VSLFVPDDFEPPTGLEHEAFRLEPLGPEHTESDYAAWTSSMDHIHATPGFDGWPWPHPMTIEENRGDLEQHAEDFAGRTGFTYTVLAPGPGGAEGTVIGCVYIYPSEEPGVDAPGSDALVRSWVRATDAELDPVLYRAVSDWLRTDAWPFERVTYAERPGEG
jgi:hypothetical protein